jgi:hypothetical protein
MKTQRISHASAAIAVFLGLAVPALAAAADARLKLDVGDFAARAKEVVNITIDKSTMDWALKAISSKGGNEAELRELMTDLDAIYVQVLEFDKENAPAWNEMFERAQKGVLSKLDGPGWTPVVSVTERGKDGDEVVRISLHTDETGQPGGLAVFVLERYEIVLVNIAGHVTIDKLARIGTALGKPGMFGPLGEGKDSSEKATKEAKPTRK